MQKKIEIEKYLCILLVILFFILLNGACKSRSIPADGGIETAVGEDVSDNPVHSQEVMAEHIHMDEADQEKQ